MKYSKYLWSYIRNHVLCMELKICMGGEHHKYYKHTKFRQNLRGDPKFLVELTLNDPIGKFDL